MRISRHVHQRLVSLLAILAISSCGKKTAPVSRETRSEEIISQPLRELSASRLALARFEAENRQLDRALLLTLSAWQTNPASPEAAEAFGKLLCETTRAFPVSSFRFPFPIRHIAPLDDEHALIAFGEEAGTVIRWNTATATIESILFPVPGEEIRSLVIDPTVRRFVMERAGFLLLCDAVTLKPIADLGSLPADTNPQSSVVFSSDGALLAHPAAQADGSITWLIRGTTDGGILRRSDPQTPPALAAHIGHDTLTLLHADGSRSCLPANPTKPVAHFPLDPPVRLTSAVFSTNGASAMVLQQTGPASSPSVSMLDLAPDDDGSLESAALLVRFPWSAAPNIWNGLLHDSEHALFRVAGKQIAFFTGNRAPVSLPSPVTALACRNGQLLAGGNDGTFTSFRLFPAASVSPFPQKPDETLVSLSNALTGLAYQPATHTFTPLAETERRKLLDQINFKTVSSRFPSFPAKAWENFHKLPRPATAPPETIIPLADRILRADPSRTTWPGLLEKTGTLTLTPWHRSLATRLAGSGNFPDPAAEVRAAFASGNKETITQILATLPGNGPAAATALELALASHHAEWIQAAMLRAKELPPLLRRIALSRIALLENRTADALAGWPDPFPDITEDRKRHDWDGWEEADFSPALAALRDRVTHEIAAITLPTNPTPEQRQEIAGKLSQPDTLRTVGQVRFVSACTQAAGVLAKFPENAENALTLAGLATRFGGDPAPLLRAEATALCTLQRFPEARDRWVKLISEIPRERQEPNDYAEAAYTAYESQDFLQAMEILTTGTHRFPRDAGFALRAGWISLLTGESGQAYRFLVIGRQIGYPADKEENATALLVIAAARAGALEDSSAFRKELLRLNPRWNDPATLDSLAWPEEFKAILRNLPTAPAPGSAGVLPEKPKQ